MIKSYKIRLLPTKEQEKQLLKSVNIARFIYNWTLNRQNENYKEGNKFISDNDLRKELTILKKNELYFLNEVSNNIAKQAVKDCCSAALLAIHYHLSSVTHVVDKKLNKRPNRPK